MSIPSSSRKLSVCDGAGIPVLTIDECAEDLRRIPPSLASDLLSELIQFATNRDFTDVVKLAEETSPSREVRFKILDDVLGAWSVDIPFAHRKEQTAALIMENPDAVPQKAIAEVIDLEVRENPRGSFAWAKALPVTNAREHAIACAVTRWAEFDPVSASEEIIKMPPGRDRDVAAQELVMASQDDLKVAFANAAAISDAQVQFDAAAAVLMRWRLVDPSAVLDQLRNSTIAPAMVQKLETLVPPEFFAVTK